MKLWHSWFDSLPCGLIILHHGRNYVSLMQLSLVSCKKSLPPERISSFFLAILMVSWYSFTSESMKQIPLNFRTLSSLGFPFAHSSFSFLSGFAKFGPYFWTYMILSGSRLNFCQSLHGPPVSWKWFSFSRVDFVNPVQETD